MRQVTISAVQGSDIREAIEFLKQVALQKSKTINIQDALRLINTGDKDCKTSLVASSLPLVIAPAVGNPSLSKILEVIKSYQTNDHKMIGAFHQEQFSWCIGSLPNWQVHQYSPY